MVEKRFNQLVALLMIAFIIFTAVCIHGMYQMYCGIITGSVLGIISWQGYEAISGAVLAGITAICIANVAKRYTQYKCSEFGR